MRVYSTSAASHPPLNALYIRTLHRVDDQELRHTEVFVNTNLVSLHSGRFDSQGIRQVGGEVGIHGRYIPERLSAICLERQALV
jgi:hypothetical protein